MEWLRLWHDMPNDPKWRTIARVSARPISEVMAIYCHLLVMASSNPDRGYVQGVTCHDMSRENVTNVTAVTCHELNFLEGLSTALDLDIEHVEVILSAMQGRVLDGARVSGWDVRQPLREDAGNAETGAKSAAQRKREERERKKKQEAEAAGHDMSRTVTHGHDRLEEIREETPIVFTEPARFFPMPLEGWEPDSKSFKAIAFKNSVPVATLTPELLAEFVSYWHVRPEREQSQAQWEYQLVAYLKTQIQFAANSEGKANGHPRPENTTGTSPGQRPGRQRSLSAPEQVRAAIAERQAREAREAGTGASGQAVDQDDGDVRPSLDGEFRRIS